MGYLTAVDADGTGYRVLDPEHDVGPGGFALSPDGQTIAYGGGSTGWLYRWDVGAEEFDPAEYGLVGTKGVHIGSPAWSPDGTKLAWVVAGGFADGGNYRLGIGVFDLVTHTATLVHPYVPVGIGGWPPAPAWSPDGRWLAFEAWARDPDLAGVWVAQVDGTGENEHHLGQGSRPVWSPSGEQMAFHRVSPGGESAIWTVKSDLRESTRLGLPPDAVLVDWIAADIEFLPSGSAPSTPAATGTASALQIAAFRVEPAEIEPGDVVTLSWAARGTQATICPSARYALFTPDDCWLVPLSGTTTFTTPLETGGNRALDFLLTVDAMVEQRSVTLQCHTYWFFSDKPQSGICPLEAIRSYATAQRFEHGTMIWIEELGRYVILVEVLPAGDAFWKKVAHAQDPLEIVRDTAASIAAPDGLYAPTEGLGLVWRGDVSGSPGFRDTLGWALAPEFGYETIWQCDNARPSGGAVLANVLSAGPGWRGHRPRSARALELLERVAGRLERVL
jgi:hypothetical protein